MSNIQTKNSRRDRAVGAMVGLAVGDALGTTLAGYPRNHGPPHTEIVGGGWFQLAAGQWTDDTAMTLALSDSLRRCGGFDPADVADAFADWFRTGKYSCTGHCFDIGRTTKLAIQEYLRSGNPFSGLSGLATASNGSLMRLAPVVVFAGQDAHLAVQLAGYQSRITHAAVDAVESCQFAARIVADLIAGAGSAAWDPARIFRRRSEQLSRVAAGSFLDLDRTEVRATGYVVDTLEAALWATASTGSFEAALIRAVNLGGDADTVGAVTGQFAGAMYGLSNIPKRWLDQLAWRDCITQTAVELFDSGP